MSEPLLAVHGLSKTFASAGRRIVAVDAVDCAVAPGETLALVGASGSGKTTLARLIMRLIEPDRGTIAFEGRDWLAVRGSALRRRRARLQMVFQDPLAALNPRADAARAIGDPLRIHGIGTARERPDRIVALLQRVSLPPDFTSRPIRAMSGGQRQRVAIARALASEPALIVLDEAVSALDVSVRAQILNLLLDLQAERQLSYLFVSHDLGVVQAIAHRVAVMQAGRIVEEGATSAVLGAPSSDAARALVAAVPRLPILEETP